MSWGVERQLRRRLMQKLDELEPAGDPWPVYWELSTRRARRKATAFLLTWMLMPSLVAVVFLGTAQVSKVSWSWTSRAEAVPPGAASVAPRQAEQLVVPGPKVWSGLADDEEWIEELFSLWPSELDPERRGIQPQLPPRLLFAGDVGGRRLATFAVGDRTVWFDGQRGARPASMFLLPGYAQTRDGVPARVVRGLPSLDGRPTQVLLVLAPAGSTVRLHSGGIGDGVGQHHFSMLVGAQGYLAASLSPDVSGELLLYVDLAADLDPRTKPQLLYANR